MHRPRDGGLVAVSERESARQELTQGQRSACAWARYVALNPVRARLVARAEDWPWSSVRAHLAGKEDELVTVRPLLDRIVAADRPSLFLGGAFESSNVSH
jgi:hypothetical protein